MDSERMIHGSRRMDMGFDPVIGKPSEIYIEQINKNQINEESTLTYRFPQYTPTDTLLRLNGEVVIDSAIRRATTSTSSSPTSTSSTTTGTTRGTT